MDGWARRSAATTGVETSTELIKYLLAGADVVMTASALSRHGPECAAVLLDGLCEWMGRKGYATVEELRGLLAVPVGVDEPHASAGTTSAHYGKPTAPITAPGDELRALRPLSQRRRKRLVKACSSDRPRELMT